MDFIDDFIEEYKCNPCLWKADSVDFRNRSRRQQAYEKLIEVATKHGEVYNVERTKQKINNLRCAFRHQLRKYNEVKKKEKYEPYCPKRRYFESLMFLKDEEIPDKKSKRDDNIPSQPNYTDNSVTVQTENCEEYSDAESLPKHTKQNGNSKLSPHTEFCGNIFDESEIGADPILSVQTTNTNFSGSGATIREVEILPPSNAITSQKRKSLQETSFPDAVKDKINTGIRMIDFESDKRVSSGDHKYKVIRKRSSSVSSQISNENEVQPTGKFLRADISNIDFERLFSLALKSADSHLDDHFTNIGKMIAHKLRSMESTQAIYAEKIIADVLYQGQMKMLSTLSIHQFIGVDNATVYVENHSK